MKSIGGFYYVAPEDGAGEAAGAENLIECRGRGILRKRGVTPAVGDRCVVTLPDSSAIGLSDKVLSTVDEILPRRNILTRPAVANLDKLFVVVSSCKPRPNLTVIDRLIAVAEYDDIEPVLVLTKLDLGDLSDLEKVYKSAGFKTLAADYTAPGSLGAIRDEMRGCLSAFAGNSGVGKSTLLNALFPHISQETGETSEKLGRGRHTTRSVQLFCVEEDGKNNHTYIADTPGFSSFDGDFGVRVPAGKLELCFREFAPYLAGCKFVSCAHVKDGGCAVLEALGRGEIQKSRHASYAAMYEEARQVKDWER